MTAGRLVIQELVANADALKRVLRESANLRAIGNAAYNRFIAAAQKGAGVDEILMKLPIGIIHEPREFAEKFAGKPNI